MSYRFQPTRPIHRARWWLMLVPVLFFSLTGVATAVADEDAMAILQEGYLERQSLRPGRGLELAEQVLEQRDGNLFRDTVRLQAVILAGACFTDLGLIHDADTLIASVMELAIDQPGIPSSLQTRFMVLRASIEVTLGHIPIADSLLDRVRPLLTSMSEADWSLLGQYYETQGLLFLEKGQTDDADSLCAILEQHVSENSGNSTADTYRVRLLRAMTSHSQGLYSEADSALQSLAEFVGNTYGADHFQNAAILTRQALTDKALGRYEESERRHRESLRIREKLFPELSIPYIEGLDNLSSILWVRGKYEEVDRLTGRILSLTRRLFGPCTLRFADAIEAVGYNVVTRGEYLRGDTLFRDVLEIQRQVLGDSNVVVANTLVNLAVISRLLRRPAEAERLLERSLQIRRGLLGDSHPLVAQTMNTLAQVSLDQKKTRGVEALLHNVLRIRATSLGTESQEYAQTLNLLADVHELEGRPADATPLLRQALEIRQKTFGDYHANVWHNLRRLAHNYIVRGEIDSALNTFEECSKRQRRYMSVVLSDASESVKLQWAYQSEPHDDSFLSFMLEFPRSDILYSAYRESVSNKAAVLETLMAERRDAVCRDDPAILSLVEALADMRSRVSAVILGRATEADAALAKDSLDHWISSEDSLAAKLSRFCADYEGLHRRLTVEPVSVYDNLIDGQVIFDYVRYVPSRFDSLNADVYSRTGHHYLLYVVDKSGVRTAIDLGPADSIDSIVDDIRMHVSSVRDRFYSPLTVEYEKDLQDITSALYRLIIGPAAGYLDSARHVIISPEGTLCLLPFQILCDTAGRYLIEEIDISYVVSAREVRGWTSNSSSWQSAWIVADPAYSLDSSRPAADVVVAARGTSVPNPDGHAVEQVSPTECLPYTFDRTAFGLTEAEFVEEALTDAAHLERTSVFTGRDASEAVFDTLRSPPDIIHIITHGFFCDQGQRPSAGRTVSAVSPLSRSGLVLAGANSYRRDMSDNGTPRDDGLLTALEISSLHLDGTDLVTLSGCETGMGQVFGSEGTLGLRRAFQHAGARSVVMSLWKVPDYETSGLMTFFYERRACGSSKSAALREATLEMMETMHRNFGHTHPSAWGAFILSGDWR